MWSTPTLLPAQNFLNTKNWITFGLMMNYPKVHHHRVILPGNLSKLRIILSSVVRIQRPEPGSPKMGLLSTFLPGLKTVPQLAKEIFCLPTSIWIKIILRNPSNCSLMMVTGSTVQPGGLISASWLGGILKETAKRGHCLKPESGCDLK